MQKSIAIEVAGGAKSNIETRREICQERRRHGEEIRQQLRKLIFKLHIHTAESVETTPAANNNRNCTLKINDKGEEIKVEGERVCIDSS